MRSRHRHLSGEMTVAAFAVSDWSLVKEASGYCSLCGIAVKGKELKKHPLTNEIICVECLNDYHLHDTESQLLDDLDALRSMGVEPPRAAVDELSDAILYGLDNDGLDYWD
jgi:hypothetical protein